MPSAVDKVPYAEVRDIDFTSVSTKKRRLDSVINGEDVQQERQPLKLPYVPEPTALERWELLRDLHAANARSSVLTVSSGFQDEFIPHILQDGNLPQPLRNVQMKTVHMVSCILNAFQSKENPNPLITVHCADIRCGSNIHL
ncbi:hypothetical protein DPMN_071766 [Dreissena polymorpha]|uniref:Uncharacterized protein n=1 Tax=Dreissena polymorpha TaxID=45954 RepID=A0A9D3Z5A2_DREPO|nr:hypothetical protein DPMN_071766 [Dreissena polymorpha]